MSLVVLEHQKIYIGHKRDLEKFQISKADAEAIRAIDINNNGIFKWGNRYIIPQQWIGVISLPGLSIEILPKISNEENQNKIKEILLFMFNVSSDIPTKNNISAKINFTKNGLVEILISNFIQKVEYYIREGLIYSYNKTINNLNTVKGTIDFSKQINKNIMNPTRFVCKYSKLDIDNNINKYIKYTLIEMKNISRDYSNIRRLNTLLLYFDDVGTFSVNQIQKINILINRINSRVKEIIDYCNLFLEGFSVSLSNGEYSISSMLFDMNKIFEKFIYKYYKKIYGSNVTYQYNRNYLISNKADGTKKIKLKPDILIDTRKGFKMVLDTKWKIIKSFVKESDVYQMNAYVSAIPSVDIAILIYPQASDTKTIIGNYNFCSSGLKKELKIRTVDLSLVGNDKLFIDHLKKLLI